MKLLFIGHWDRLDQAGQSNPPLGSCTAFVRTDLAYEALVCGSGYDHRRTESLMDSLAVEKVKEAAAPWGKTS